MEPISNDLFTEYFHDTTDMYGADILPVNKIPLESLSFQTPHGINVWEEGFSMLNRPLKKMVTQRLKGRLAWDAAFRKYGTSDTYVYKLHDAKRAYYVNHGVNMSRPRS